MHEGGRTKFMPSIFFLGTVKTEPFALHVHSSQEEVCASSAKPVRLK